MNTTRSMVAATVGTTNADVTFSAARSGSVQSFVDRVACAVGVDGREARHAGVQREQQVEALLLTDLADDDAVRGLSDSDRETSAKLIN